jgi:hypothetical protein
MTGLGLPELREALWKAVHKNKALVAAQLANPNKETPKKTAYMKKPEAKKLKAKSTPKPKAKIKAAAKKKPVKKKSR